MTKKILILGLGNPGPLYKNTRHNIGQDFVSWLKEQYQTSTWQIEKKNFAQISTFEDQNKKILFALPLVFMNETGKTIQQLQKYYQISLKNIIIVHDDNDIYVGNFKFSFDRGSAGHKGIESIIKNLHSKKFFRLRIGIQPQGEQRKKAENLVLKKFSPEERKIITENFVLMKKTIEDNLEN
ncbi:MAG: aminoacyl-tRNA hydrolase [Candidatus Paceibacterota bacterium]|jgi:PTH1 family peptidyl-tRNA hydrolase